MVDGFLCYFTGGHGECEVLQAADDLDLCGGVRVKRKERFSGKFDMQWRLPAVRSGASYICRARDAC